MLTFKPSFVRRCFPTDIYSIKFFNSWQIFVLGNQISRHLNFHHFLKFPINFSNKDFSGSLFYHCYRSKALFSTRLDISTLANNHDSHKRLLRTYLCDLSVLSTFLVTSQLDDSKIYLFDRKSLPT